MVAESTNFWAKRKQRRTRSSFFARCPEVFAALGEDCGWEGNLNRRGRRFSQRNDWGVTQRYIYSPYGSLIVLNADFSTPPVGTQPISGYLYQGMTLDAVTGLYYARNRNYSPPLGVWISQDPAVYINGANTYQMEGSSPTGRTDPQGTDFIALADHLIGHGFALLFRHYSIDYWKGCTNAKNPAIGVREDVGQFKAANRNMHEAGAVELEPYAYHTWIYSTSWGSFGPEYNPPLLRVFLVSFVVFTDKPAEFEDIYSGTAAQVATTWKSVVAAANSYKFAEHAARNPTHSGWEPAVPGSSFQNWPNSDYQFPPGGNNSNTFAETTVKAAGIPWGGLPGSHPGNDTPVPVVGVSVSKNDLSPGAF